MQPDITHTAESKGIGGLREDNDAIDDEWLRTQQTVITHDDQLNGRLSHRHHAPSCDVPLLRYSDTCSPCSCEELRVQVKVNCCSK